MEISVALATYNGDRYIKEQIESILNQTLTPDEIIVMDDNSDDNTAPYIQEYKEDFPDIIVFEQNEKNLGMVKNFEKALRLCEGDVIALADQDDIWHEDKLERQADLLAEEDADLVCHDSRFFIDSSEQVEFKDKTFWEISNKKTLPQNDTPRELITTLLSYNFSQGSTYLFNADFLEFFLPIPSIRHHDWWILILTAIYGDVYGIDEPLMDYRKHDKQTVGIPITTNIFDNIKMECIRSPEFYTERVDRYQQLYNRIQRVDNRQPHLPQDELEEIICETSEFWKSRVAIQKMAVLSALYLSAKMVITGKYSKFGRLGMAPIDFGKNIYYKSRFTPDRT